MRVMFAFALLLPLLAPFAAQGGKVDAPTLEYYQGSFSVRIGTSTLRVPLLPKPHSEREVVSFRRNDHYAVWDSRGLTIRHGDRVRTTRLEEIPTSPRLFSQDEIKETLTEINAKRRVKGATALAGSMRVGGDAYLLLRWNVANGGGWADVLVRVPLAGDHLWPEVLGRIDGISIAYKPIDDRLFLFGDRLATVVRQGKSWGVASYDLKASKFDFQLMGSELLSYLSTGRKTGLFVERTAYGTVAAGRADLGSGQRKVMFEDRGFARFIDGASPSIVLASLKGGMKLHNADTGAQVDLPTGAGVARAGDNLLVWAPATDPKSAWLYDPFDWSTLAVWISPPNLPGARASSPAFGSRTSRPVDGQADSRAAKYQPRFKARLRIRGNRKPYAVPPLPQPHTRLDKPIRP